MAVWKLLRDSQKVALMQAGAAVVKGTPVKLSSNEVVPNTDGAALWGVCLNAGSSGDMVAVDIGNSVYQVQAASGVNFGLGDLVYQAASYEVDAGSSGNLSCGAVVDRDPATAGLVAIVITPAAVEQTTHA